MSLVITILILILFTSVIVFGFFAVFMAISTVVNSTRTSSGEGIAVVDGAVDVYFRKPKAKVKVDSAKSQRKEAKKDLNIKKTSKKSSIIAARLKDLPQGYHLLDDLKINLPSPFNYKGQKIDKAEIKNLVIAPRRLYVMEAVNGSKKNLADIARQTDKNACLVSLFLSQKLKKDFRVCGWVVGDKTSSSGSYPAKVISEDELRGSLIKHERYSQGKKHLKASEHIPEIISELKLAAWEG